MMMELMMDLKVEKKVAGELKMQSIILVSIVGYLKAKPIKFQTYVIRT